MLLRVHAGVDLPCDNTLICLGLFMQLAIAKNNIIKLQEENQHLRSENGLILLKSQQQFEVHTHPRPTVHQLKQAVVV